MKTVGVIQYEPPSIHPAVKKFLGKAPRETSTAASEGIESQKSEESKKIDSEELSKSETKEGQKVRLIECIYRSSNYTNVNFWPTQIELMGFEYSFNSLAPKRFQFNFR